MSWKVNLNTSFLLIISDVMILAFLSQQTIANGGPGSLDSSFGINGFTTTDISICNNGINGVSIQPDGKIIAVGYTWAGSSILSKFSVARFNTDGSFDNDFGIGGKVITDLGLSDAQANAIVIQDDGKILVAGEGGGYDSVFALVRYNADGSLDTSFGTDGFVLTNIGSTGDAANGIALQDDGKIVLAGYGGYNPDFVLVRYNNDGSLDTTFDGDGIVMTDIYGGKDYAYDVMIQSDDKIVAAGYVIDDSSNNKFALVRYNTDGSLDTSFSSDGIQVTTMGSTYYGHYIGKAYSVRIQSDGKIILAGVAYNGGIGNFALARYNTNGSLDNSFSGDGKVFTNVDDNPAYASAISIQTDGKIIAVGKSYVNSDADFTVIRYDTTGILDSSFDADGILVTAIGLDDDFAEAVAIQDNNNIVVGGTVEYSTPYSSEFVLVRYDPNGGADVNFGGVGKVTDSFGTSEDYGYALAIQDNDHIAVAGTSNGRFALAWYDASGNVDVNFGSGGKAAAAGGSSYCTDMALQNDGKTILAGYATNLGDGDFVLIRYNSEGTLDSGFGIDGKVTTDFFGKDDRAYAVAIQADGKIIVGGYSEEIDYNYEFALARYNHNGSLDPNFDGDGKVITQMPGWAEEIQSIVIQNDGKIIAVGYGQDAGDFFILMSRYNLNGELDSSFGSGGQVVTHFGTDADPQGYDVTIQGDGKIVVVGCANNGSDDDFAIARYNNDGSLDPSFDDDGRVTTDFGISNDHVYGVTTTPDSKIIVTGFVDNGSSRNIALAQYNSNGGLDSNFSGDGLVVTDVNTSDNYAGAIGLQSDGKIVVAGYGYVSNGTYDFILARYLGTPIPIVGDFEPDGDVDWADLAVLAEQWLQPPGIPSADIAPAPDGDGAVNMLDFAAFANNWLVGVE